MIIYRYILRNHAVPFIFANFTLIAIFLLQFLMKAADKLVGKGLSAWVIIKLVSYNLAWMVVLVVPMATLVATLMAFGNMAQNNEIAILKAAGISLYKMIITPLIASVLLVFLLIQFNNNIYPDANHAARLLMQDISHKKPTLSLVPGVFSQEVPNYSILVRDIDQNTNLLKEVTIYDHSDPMTVNIVTAETGRLYFSRDQENLIMDLKNGEIHTSEIADADAYRKVLFDRHKIAMSADRFTFKQTGPGGQRGDRELSAQDMLVIVDSLKSKREGYLESYRGSIDENFLLADSSMKSDGRDRSKKMSHIILRIENTSSSEKNVILSKVNRLEGNLREINRYWVEIHKKYALPAACIVFILIGAPLGTMTRKGGFGVAAGISLLFFLVYWAFLIGGEKLADRGMLSPFWGMWSANILLAILGVLLLVKVARERVTLNLKFISKLLPRQFKSSFEEEDDENEDT